MPTLAEMLLDKATGWQCLTLHGWYCEGDFGVEIDSDTDFRLHAGIAVVPIS